MALPLWVAPAIKGVTTGLQIAWTYISGKLWRQKTALENAHEAREIDGEVGAMPDPAIRDELRKRARERSGGG